MKSLAESWADPTTSAGKLILTVMSGVAAFERDRIKERQREGIEAAKKAGKYQGGVIRFDPAKIRELAAQGISQAAIARQLGCDPKTVMRALRVQEPESA
jgi:DNA invertase Pin-like site-specific DNA recombinase